MNNIAYNSLSKKLGIIILMRMKNHKECGKGKKKRNYLSWREKSSRKNKIRKNKLIYFHK